MYSKNALFGHANQIQKNMLTTKEHKNYQERYEFGKSLQEKVPLESHGEWSPRSGRPNPVQLIEDQNKDRLSWLVPIRRGRMARSAFSFYRGGARIMASDLADTTVSGLQTQICGDAHLANFGAYASPERNLVFDLNDFDETLPGPWEWDVKRAAASFIIAGRYNGLNDKESCKVSRLLLKTYREFMAELAQMSSIDVWYNIITTSEMLKASKNKEIRQRLAKGLNKTKRKTHYHAFERLTEEVNGEYRIRSQHPLIFPQRDLSENFGNLGRDELRGTVNTAYDRYYQQAPDHIQHLLQDFRLVDAAIKVVGVGSVGTLCGILLLEDSRHKTPFFLQIKQASRSVLENHLPPSQYPSSGERVVRGQRLMQTVSDMFLGSTISETTGNHYYWRQLKDWKGGFEVEAMNFLELLGAAELEGQTLARAHARSGDPIAISGYLGFDKAFDRAVTKFAERYAEQNEKDYQAFIAEIESKQLETKEI